MKHFFFRLRNIFFVAGAIAVLAGLFYAAASFSGLRNTLVREIHETREETDRLSRNFEFLSRDSNEVRAALGLPARDYPDFETGAAPAGEQGNVRAGETLMPYYQAVEKLVWQTEKNERDRALAGVFASDTIKALQTKNNYKIRQEADALLWEKDGKIWFTFRAASGKAGFEATTFTGASLVFDSAGAGLAGFLETEGAALADWFKNTEQLSAQFRGALRDQSLTSELRTSGLVLDALAETPDEVTANISLASERGASRMRVGFNKKNNTFFIDAKTYADIFSFRGSLPAAIRGIDLRSADELLIAKAQKQLQELFDDDGFTAYLGTKNLTLSRTPNEDDEYIYYDFLTQGGRRAGSLGIQKKIGEIYLFDDEYVSLGSLKTLGLGKNQGGDSKKKELNLENLNAGAASGSGKIYTILVAGAHERMTDTLILANINEDKQLIDLISLPRDLFYKNRKINGIYYRYGPERLAEEISDLTGLNIENYLVIDMFAFIDVINILGGVDISLNEPLVDPTYRVRDNGRWSTLFYAAGTHHLNGVEALRVARSRHFSSDFGRARRQQNILAAIKDRLTSLGVSDMGKLYELVIVLTKYVETDLTPYELVNCFVRYKSAKIRSQNVLDTRNILYHSYTNLRHMNLTEDEVDADFDKGAYILLPQNDDWALMRRYIRSLVEGAST
ncbi:MAG: LCP family protein [Spirochaetales bacterium]|nr:LCP family protein [Spirochaetales bacterium]